MKHALLSLVVLAAIGCNSAPDRGGNTPTVLNADDNKDSSTYLLKRLFGEFPRGGRFGGHRAISGDGNINFKVLFSDTSILKADGLTKVTYTYFNGTDSLTETKEINFGLPSSN